MPGMKKRNGSNKRDEPATTSNATRNVLIGVVAAAGLAGVVRYVSSHRSPNAGTTGSNSTPPTKGKPPESDRSTLR